MEGRLLIWRWKEGCGYGDEGRRRIPLSDEVVDYYENASEEACLGIFGDVYFLL
jgi:hypothetical protein